MAVERTLAIRHVMQANKSKNTGPELKVREALRNAGYTGYRLHWKKAPGHPDICFPGRKLAIFVNGCYWHRCPYCTGTTPKSNVEFWEAKFARNQSRDLRDYERLESAGWEVVVLRECRLKKGRAPGTLADLVDVVRERTEELAEGLPKDGRHVEIGKPSVLKLAQARKRLSRARR